MQASNVNLLQIASIHKSAVHAVDATPQPDAKAITPSNKALNTLGTTPIDVYTLSSYLEDYNAKSFIINGFLHGFHLQYSGPRLFREAKKLKSALSNTHIVQQKINKEIALQRVGGTISIPTLSVHSSFTLGLVPKKDGDYRLIHHLSYPENQSINFHRPPGLHCSLCINRRCSIYHFSPRARSSGSQIWRKISIPSYPNRAVRLWSIRF